MGTHQPCTVRGRIADLAPLQNGQLTANTGCGVLGRADYMQGPDTLAVQTSVLRKALRWVKEHLMNFYSYGVKRISCAPGRLASAHHAIQSSAPREKHFRFE